MSQYHGVIAAAVTPRGQQGEIDFGATFELIDHCCRGGVQGILLFGDESESAPFSPEERSRLAYLAAKRSRVPVLVGAGSPALDVSIGLARDAAGAGAAGILVPPPCFQRCDAEDLAQFYTQFARQAGSGAPILLYDAPSLAGGLSTATALGLLEARLFAGIVEAEPHSFACLAASARAFELLACGDTLFLEARQAGFPAVTTLGCAVPQLAVALDRALAAGIQAEIDRLAGLFHELLVWTARFPPQVIVKTAAALQGLKTGPLPVPLSPAKHTLLEEFRGWFRSWLPAIKKASANA